MQRNIYILLTGFALIFGLTALSSNQRAQLSYSACIGKAYGTPGCPIIPSPPAPPNCGDGIIDEDEECDEGRFNGGIFCSNRCEPLYCGDSVITISSEECDPGYKVYGETQGELVLVFDYTQIENFANQCGSNVCIPPFPILRDTQGNPIKDEEGRFQLDSSKGFLPNRCTYGNFTNACEQTESGQAQNQKSTIPEPVSLTFPFAAAPTSQSQTSQAATSSEDTQSQSSTAPRCGDGTVDDNEFCDAKGADTALCDSDCTVPLCGDGYRNKAAGEQCDDGNEINTDTCTDICTAARCGDGYKQAGEQCDDGNQVNTDTCRNDCSIPICGDGRIDSNEECDDGNFSNSDECTNQCKQAKCGNGVKDGKDQCDDGNTVNTDGCKNDCTVPYCGDAVVTTSQPYAEECDDGNTLDTDHCTNSCKKAVCGDGIVQTQRGEQCDDGNDIADDACTNTCEFAVCGDGIVQSSEQCDDGNANNADECSDTCTIPFCGDGIVGGSEECDDGNKNNLDACLNTCTLPVCGNATIEGLEECDDGNTRSGDGCSIRCNIETMCGDGVVDGIEECDDGDLNSKNEPNACRLNCRNAFCGDGVVDDGEECDSTDGCTAECRFPTFMAAHGSSIWGGTVSVIVLVGAGLGLFFHKRLKEVSKKASETVRELSIDDVPLDELEMPWHKWDGKR